MTFLCVICTEQFYYLAFYVPFSKENLFDPNMIRTTRENELRMCSDKYLLTPNKYNKCKSDQKQTNVKYIQVTQNNKYFT